MNSVVRRLARKIKYATWALNGYAGRTISTQRPEKATVLLTYFNPARMEHIDHQARNILKCNFVERLILSNHNAAIQIETRVNVSDKRIVFVNQLSNRGCGYRWNVAQTFHPEYLIVIDDDILLFPWQLARLFDSLVHNPEIPHGITGMLHTEDGQFNLIEQENAGVDYLCEIYAVTREHLIRFSDLRQQIADDARLAEMIDTAADFMVISQSGSDRPRIHDVGRLFRCTSYNEPGVAVHQASQFSTSLIEVSGAIENLNSHVFKQEMLNVDN